MRKNIADVLKNPGTALPLEFEADMSDIELDIADYDIPTADLEDDLPAEEPAVCPESCEECTETSCAQEEISPDAVIEEEKAE